MKPVTLVILDGWGVAPLSEGNAIERAKTPNFSQFLLRYPSATLEASGEAVGLPHGEVGNSEVGHLTIGLGRVYYQPLPRITRSILSKTFFDNEALKKAMLTAASRGSRLHLLGLVSTGGVHSTLEHLFALLEMARMQNVHRVFVHAIMDGRDSPFNSGMQFLQRIQERLTLFAQGSIASMTGRFWAMDRDTHWDRTLSAFETMARGRSSNVYHSPLSALQRYYNTAVYDEMIPPTVMVNDAGEPTTTIDADDVVIFFNFRSDRIRQLAHLFNAAAVSECNRGEFLPPLMVTFTEYDSTLRCLVAFPNERTDNTLAETVSIAGFKQLHAAETEKYAHVSYFINGYQEKPFAGEMRILIPSPRVSSYSEVPAMSGPAILNRVLDHWKNDGVPALTIINFANADMIGHTGNFDATRSAIQVVDTLLGKLWLAVQHHNGSLVITADHGNAEELIDRGTGRMKTSHTANPVPFLLLDTSWAGHGSGKSLSVAKPIGGLADVAPTVLSIMGIPQPGEMTGTNLIPALIAKTV